ncbi:unnamed protein product, partial [Rotaria socialis]
MAIKHRAFYYNNL